ncbi:MAG TPA: ParB/RepB/Spo0J family partition protein [Actinomycetes bacterium]|nr:ParB/RepB/Spo0J family partition protein [Actinomycetes bacterium]
MISELAIDSIREWPTNPRRAFGDLTELTESIRKAGVLQPVLARPVPKQGKDGKAHELVFGHRRYRAAQAAGLGTIPAMVREMTDIEVLEAQLIENCQRTDIHPLEEAQGYFQLVTTRGGGYDAARIAERVGRSVAYVYDRLKLLRLTKQAQELFLAGHITAGHAVILARLKPEDQKRAIGEPGEGPLLYEESLLWDPNEDDGDEPPLRLKAISVRELQAWVDKNVRFDTEAVEPMLFPATAQTITEAREEAEKIVPITHDHHVTPEAKPEDGSRTYGPMSWRRADGREKSKTCAHAVTGVIVVGYGRGEAFKVCIDKKKCQVHWGEEQKAAKKRASAASKGGKTGEDRWEIQRRRDEAAEKREAAARDRWKKAAPAILEAVAAAVKKASPRAGGLLGELLVQGIWPKHYGPPPKLVSRGSTAEDLVRHVAFLILASEASDSWRAPREFPKRAKAFGIDVRKILDQVVPEEAPEPACRECGCTESNACEGGCSWVEPDLCSACAPAKPAKAKKKKKASRR